GGWVPSPAAARGERAARFGRFALWWRVWRDSRGEILDACTPCKGCKRPRSRVPACRAPARLAFPEAAQEPAEEPALRRQRRCGRRRGTPLYGDRLVVVGARDR